MVGPACAIVSCNGIGRQVDDFQTLNLQLCTSPYHAHFMPPMHLFQQPWLERFAENTLSTSDAMMKNGEALALLATLLIVVFLPEVVHHGMK